MDGTPHEASAASREAPDDGSASVDCPPGCECITSLSEIHASDIRLIFTGDGKRQELGAVERVINSDVGYAVWVAPDDPYRVHFMITDAYVAKIRGEKENAENMRRFNLVWNKVSTIRNEIEVLSVDDEQTAKAAIDLVGNAVGSGLEFDVDAMEDGLRSAYAMVYGAKRRALALAFTIHASAAAFSFIVIAVAGLLVGSSLLASGPAVYWFERTCIGVLGGAIGAAISVLSSFNAGAAIDVMAKSDQAAKEGSFRVVFGVLCGVIAMLGVCSGLILDGDVSSPSLLLFSAVGGFAEQFIPNTLRNIASTSEQPTREKFGASSDAPNANPDGAAQ